MLSVYPILLKHHNREVLVEKADGYGKVFQFPSFSVLIGTLLLPFFSFLFTPPHPPFALFDKKLRKVICCQNVSYFPDGF